jgi:hypothetical protein
VLAYSSKLYFGALDFQPIANDNHSINFKYLIIAYMLSDGFSTIYLNELCYLWIQVLVFGMAAEDSVGQRWRNQRNKVRG